MEGSLFRLDKHLWPIGASIVTMLAGAWLMLAPFALGYQDYGASWAPQTLNQFWLGLGVVILSIAALVLFIWRLVFALRAARIFSRPRTGQPADLPRPPMGHAAPGGWSAPSGEPAHPAYMAARPQPAAPWAPPPVAQQRPPAPYGQPYPSPSQPPPYGQSWPGQGAPSEWQPPAAGSRAAPLPSAAGQAQDVSAQSPQSHVQIPAQSSVQSPARGADGAPPYSGWPPPQPFAPPAQPVPPNAQMERPPAAPAQAPYAQGMPAQAGRATPEIPAWLQPVAPAPPPAASQPANEPANKAANEFDRAMTMLAQSLARDLAERQQGGAPAGESGPAQPTNQQPNQFPNQASQQEAMR